jgi:hypothetical protein
MQKCTWLPLVWSSMRNGIDLLLFPSSHFCKREQACSSCSCINYQSKPGINRLAMNAQLTLSKGNIVHWTTSLVFKLEKWRPVNPNGGSSLKFYVFGIIALRRGKAKIVEYTRHYAPKMHTTAPATGFFYRITFAPKNNNNCHKDPLGCRQKLLVIEHDSDHCT